MALGAGKRNILGTDAARRHAPRACWIAGWNVTRCRASHLLRGVLYGLNMVDGISFVGASVLFLAIALFASYVPSRRAMRVDPMVALRYE
jgi:hypothetical protein